MGKKKKKSGVLQQESKGAVGDINVTPLIDIVLVLLIIYMVVTPVMTHQMDINLPEKTETVPEDKVPTEQLLVATCEDGTYTFNRKVHELGPLTDSLRKKIVKKRAAGEKPVVFVDAHPEAGYAAVVKLMDAVRDAGNQANIKVKIGLASLKEEEDFVACTAPTPKVETLVAPAQEGAL